MEGIIDAKSGFRRSEGAGERGNRKRGERRMEGMIDELTSELVRCTHCSKETA